MLSVNRALCFCPVCAKIFYGDVCPDHGATTKSINSGIDKYTMLNMTIEDRIKTKQQIYTTQIEPMGMLDKTSHIFNFNYATIFQTEEPEETKQYYAERVAELQRNEIKPNIPTCPICHSTSLSKISLTHKVAKVGMFGIFGMGDNGKTWKCNKCGSKF